MFRKDSYEEEIPLIESTSDAESDEGLYQLVKEGVLEIVPRSLQTNRTTYQVTFRHVPSGAYLNYYVSERTEPTLLSLHICVPHHEERTPRQNRGIAQACREDLSKRDIGKYFES